MLALFSYPLLYTWSVLIRLLLPFIRWQAQGLILNGLHTSDSLTIRVGNLPSETIEDDVARFFNGRVGPSGVVIAKNGIGSLVPEVSRRTKLTTVPFVKQAFKVKALKECDGIGFSAQRGDDTSIVSVEDEFMGLTTLHCTEEANVE